MEEGPLFNGKYFDWNQKRVKEIVNHYGHQFMYQKSVLDLGCGYGDIGGVLYRLGANITAVDARQEHLKIVTKKFPGIKVVKADLDRDWPFYGQHFDLVLDMGILCHLSNYENHLRAVCFSTNNLVLETAVCDSDDPYKSVPIPENKGVYDLSINGMGCRPTTAAIERVLSESGMNFKRMDSPKFNSGNIVYDWQPRNDNALNIDKRRIWFCHREGQLPAQIIPNPTVISNSSTNFLQNSYLKAGSPIIQKTASPQPPAFHAQSLSTKAKVPMNISYTGGYSIDSDEIRESSRLFSLIKPELWTAPIHFDTSGVILPLTVSSSMWFKKISPFFPNLKVQRRAVNLLQFPRVDGVPDLIMCDINTIQNGNRIWIDEWANKTLSDKDLESLKNASVIFTPSLLNAQEILRAIPSANIVRTDKTWPMLNITPQQGNYFVYFEKYSSITQSLFNNWNENLGKLTVVGSSRNHPSFISYISDSEGYDSLHSTIMGSQAIIDLTANTYYLSGIQELAISMGIPVITNNTAKNDNSLIECISQITTENINQAVSKIINKKNLNYNSTFNNKVNETVKKLLGQ